MESTPTMNPRLLDQLTDRRALNPSCDADAEPTEESEARPPDPDRLKRLLDQAVAQLAFPYPFDRPSCSRSRRDGYRPSARRHVQDWIATTVFGTRVAELAQLSGRHRSTVYRGIRVGKRLAASAIAAGLSSPDALRAMISAGPGSSP